MRSIVSSRPGESSGTLTTVLARLADYYDRRDELNRKVKRAMAYPLFILGFVALVLAVCLALCRLARCDQILSGRQTLADAAVA
jgi:type II secretory pathway component PulF